MLNSLSAIELAEWEAFDRLEPIGQWRQEWNISRIVHMLHSINVSKRDRQPLSAFLPEWDQHTEPQPIEDQIDICKRWTLLLGGKVQ